MAKRWRTVHHKTIAEYYEGEFKGREKDAAFELARHHFHAGAHGRAIEHCETAAEKALAAFAPEQAVEFCEMGLESISAVAPSPGLDARRVALQERLGGAHMLLGNADSAISAYDAAIAGTTSGIVLAALYENRAKAFERKGAIEEALSSVALGKKSAPPDTLERCRLEIVEAALLFASGRYDDIIESVGKTVPTLVRLGSEQSLADAYQTLAKAYGRKGDLDNCHKHDAMALEIRQRLGDDYGIAMLLNNMAVTHYMRGDVQGAADRFEESIRIRERIGDKYGLAATLSNLSGIYFARGDWAKTLELAQQGLAIKRKIGDRSGIAKSLDIIGLVKMERGEPVAALKDFEEALSTYEGLGDKEGISHGLNYIGNVHLMIGDLDEAETIHSECLRMRKEVGDEPGMAASYNNLGNVAVEKGESAKAEELFGKALDLSTKTGEKDLIADARVNAIDLMIRLGKVEDARKGLAAAGAAMKESGMESKAPSILRLHARILAKSGELSEAKEKFAEAAGAFSAIKSLGEVAVTEYEWAMALPADGEERTALLEKALSSFESRGMRGMAEKCRKALEELVQ
jgi:tetratricopeptide (TPR) repeat protein